VDCYSCAVRAAQALRTTKGVVGGRAIAGNGASGRGRSDASGLTAGITIIAAILLGTAIGLGIGTLTGARILLAGIGAVAGLILGFYVIYIRFFRTPPA
jgi:hypothetical protein